MPERRATLWVDTIIDSNVTDGGGNVLVDLSTSAVVDRQTFTAIRWIIRLLAVPSVIANATVSTQRVSIGIGVVSRDAFVAGGAAVPSPSVMTEFPTEGWVLRDHGILVNQQDSGTVEAWHFPEFRYDIRAARKIGRGVPFLSMGNADLIAGTTAVKVAGVIRTLMKV